MKKFYYIVGAVVTAMAIFAFVAVMLKKLKISLSIEGIDDEIIDDEENTDIELTIDSDEDEDEYLKELDELMNEEADPEIEVEITEE